MRCPFPACGEEHPDDLETCPKTWLTLPRPDPPRSARLALRFDHRLVVTVPVGGSVVLGRKAPSPIAPVCRGDHNVSRAHAELTAHAPDEVVLADIESMNGTYVNDERVTVDAPRELQVGDVVELANNPPLALTVVLWPEVDPPN